MVKTLNNRMDPAEICRKNGWVPGTRLIGNEGYGPSIIEITAVGRGSILAVCLVSKWKPSFSLEGCWTLECRAWKVLTPKQELRLAKVLTARQWYPGKNKPTAKAVKPKKKTTKPKKKGKKTR